ncbi:MAG: T9SS type A sorting domain-containing protein [Candidatus Zixiibacteriota bacterium]
MKIAFYLSYIILLAASIFGQNVDILYNITYDFTAGDTNRFLINDGIFASDSNFVFVGHESFGNFYYCCDIVILKVNLDGDTLWTSRFPMDDNPWYDQYAINIVETNTDNYVIGCYKRDSPDGSLRLIKIDSLGNEIYDTGYSLMQFDFYPFNMFDFTGTIDHGFVFSGEDNQGDGFIFKIDSLGDSLWISQTNTFMNSRVIPTFDNGVIATGWGINEITTMRSFLAMKFDSMGEEVWTSHFLEADFHSGDYMAYVKNSDGTFTVATVRDSSELIAARFDNNGNTIWAASLGKILVYPYVGSVSSFGGGNLIAGDYGGGIFILGADENGNFQFKRNLTIRAEPDFAYQANDSTIYLAGGKYDYTAFLLKMQIDFTLDTDPDSIMLPTSFSLSQNHPNPFNPSTMIEYSLPTRSPVKISIYNILGQKVTTLVDETVSAGNHNVIWNGTDKNGQPVASGIYFYRIETDQFIDSKKMILLK